MTKDRNALVHYPPPANLPGVPPLSFAVAHGGVLYISGLPGRDAEGRIPEAFADQFANVVAALRDVLGQAGATLRDLIEVSVLLTRAEDVKPMNALYAEAFGPAPYPARITSVVAALPSPGLLIEIRGTARLPSGET